MNVEAEKPMAASYGCFFSRPKVRVVLFISASVIIVIALMLARGFIVDSGAVSAQAIRQDGKRAVVGNNADGYGISDLANSDMVRDLPGKASIELKLGDGYYTLSKDSVAVGRPFNPDLTISLPSSYANQISLGLCEMIQNANANGDLEIEMHSSQTSLLWKYRGMLKYKDCLG
ncbi:MAG: hypothetical protein KKD18_00990 [Nanoarchaeota archaeon]|nr:hypothetical protein [Nanoarchaeota archaeon]MBU0976970.1 hypothetical protein [Nanoarchaeota archaeon]